MKKYKFTENTIIVNNVTLYQIEALKKLHLCNGLVVKPGDLGGYIEKEDNLSHDGDCWVDDNAIVFDDAKVSGDAYVYGECMISENARISNNAEVFDHASIYGNARICAHALVYDCAKVFDNAVVGAKAQVHGNSVIHGSAHVGDNAEVCDNAEVYDNATIGGESMIYSYATVYGNADVFGDSRIGGDAYVCNNASILGDAYITKTTDYLVIGPIGSRKGFTTFFRTSDDKIYVKCGCFTGYLKEFIKKVKITHKYTIHKKPYLYAAKLAKKQIIMK